MVRTAPTASGSDGGAPRLVLTVTRACDARCSYCPTVKSAEHLSEADALRALRLFSERWGGGDVKLFGGEPLLRPSVVRAVLEAARTDHRIRRVQLSTNGLHLDPGWLALLAGHEKALLQLSLDGPLEVHARRRPLVARDADWSRLFDQLPAIAAAPRTVVTLTIPPDEAARAADHFAALLDLGFRRFNLLPGYLLPWSGPQLIGLRTSLTRIAHALRAAWEAGTRLVLRNLFVRAPLPFFDAGLVVDADGTIHAGNMALASQMSSLRTHTQVGTLDDPPDPALLAARARKLPALLQAALPAPVWSGTLAADAELTRMCESLYPSWAASRRRAATAAATVD